MTVVELVEVVVDDEEVVVRCTLRTFDLRTAARSVPPLEQPPNANATTMPPTKTLPGDAFN
ncbi:MAG: hypothetical protein JJE46_03250 [Acidimicrobiia bacterium]|nr:hypothetical protein [Acidimicrobiia bacterium]